MGRDTVYWAYVAAFKDDPTPLITAGFAGIWRVMLALNQKERGVGALMQCESQARELGKKAEAAE